MFEKNNYQGRATKEQIKALVTYLGHHPHLTLGKLSVSNGHKKFQKDWEKLAKCLNALGPNGKKKDVKSWQNTWRDQKCKVLKKVKKQTKAIIKNNLNEMKLTEQEKKIFGLSKYKNVKGLTNVPHSFPKERNISKKNAIEKLRTKNAREFFEIADKHAKAAKMLAEAKKLLKELKPPK